jgi:peptidyl-prolyl cis-trans isomerase B (cyclophilin B)
MEQYSAREGPRMVIRKTFWAIFGLIVCAGAVGCGGGKPVDKPAPTVSLPSPAGDATDSADAPVKAAPFNEAVTDEAPYDQHPPPDRTLNGLSTGKLRVEIQQLWEQIAFTTPAGKKLAYSAAIETEFGPITMALLPEIAPNHVRNFVALARSGYYDGLLFEHAIQQQGEGGPEARLELVEAGCPLGTGESGIGHLGYWLKPEFSSIKHEEGMVGACLTGAPDTAGCRFYITLTKAPVMDGNFTVFGKVAQGLDVVRTIAKQPRPDGSPPPTRPAAIRKVTIQTREVD